MLTLREMDCRMVSVAAWLLVARRGWKIKVYFEIGALLSLRLWNFDLLSAKQVLYLGEPRYKMFPPACPGLV